jgi:hypothetical protein
MHPNFLTSFLLRSLKGFNTLRLYKINDGSAQLKNITITRVKEAISSSNLINVALSNVIIKVFSATYKTGKYIPREEPLLSTFIYRFSGVNLLLDYYLLETAYSTYAAVV